MTLLDEINNEARALPPAAQRKLLKVAKSLRTRKTVTKGAARRREVQAAIRGIAGVWKGRTDLPKDSVGAVKALRERMSRSHDA